MVIPLKSERLVFHLVKCKKINSWSFRIVVLVCPDLEASVELLKVLVMVVSVKVVYEVASMVVFHRQVVAEISLIKNFTLTILVLTNRQLLAVV
jgi:hypothetical protein